MTLNITFNEKDQLESKLNDKEIVLKETLNQKDQLESKLKESLNQIELRLGKL